MAFQSINEKIKESTKAPQQPVEVNNISAKQWLFTSSFLDFANNKNKKLFIAKDQEQAEEIFEFLKDENKVLLLEPDQSPYDTVLPNVEYCNQLIASICRIYLQEKINIVLTMQSLFMLMPGEEIKNLPLSLAKNMSFSPEHLKEKLLSLGYSQKSHADDIGSFAMKGEVVDIHDSCGEVVRINYFDDEIEGIFAVSKEDWKTNRAKTFDHYLLFPTVYLLTQPEYVSNLRELIPQALPAQKIKYEKRKEIFKKLAHGDLCDNIQTLLPLFFKQRNSLYQIINSRDLCQIFDRDQSMKDYDLKIEALSEYYQDQANKADSTICAPEPSYFYQDLPADFTQQGFLFINSLKIESHSEKIYHVINPGYEKLDLFLKRQLGDKIDLTKKNALLLEFLKDSSYLVDKIIIATHDKNQRDQVRFIFENAELDFLTDEEKIEFSDSFIEDGFYYLNDNVLVLSFYDLTKSRQQTKKKKTKKNYQDLFAEQIATLKHGDFVVHQIYGIGVFEGVQNLKIGTNEGDYIVIKYKDDDKVYVPAYKTHLVQKHADLDASVTLSDLKTKKFEQSKGIARNSVKKLAFDLLKLQANRTSQKGYQFSPPGELYVGFEKKFPYQLTPDQSQAIDDVLDDMCSEKTMDRLICGDVGFGKTEVAMRAAFKAVEDGKQVAILVPTTILCMQHFNTFKNRFSGLPVKIEQISRFKSPIDTKKIVQSISDGSVDIVIGTHKLLSKDIKFKNLGLVVIDEEHRFGVGHKEQLKLMRTTADFLTLTATPIPRTLQMSFVGIKDLSIIQTPPLKRQTIKSYLVREDEMTLKNAMQAELRRGGQIFYVHNRVMDIEQEVHKVKELVPDAKITFAHGQMSEKDLEQRISDFYERKFDVLIATTIIESGIDIPSANTMIIHNAQSYGLAQLHQLRGRIGRSDRKAYCYFVIPKHQNIGDLAEKRLKALQQYSELGAGFLIANSDLEIRGAGDILGAEQSGHIRNIGVELYMELLQEAIRELQGEEAQIHVTDFEISSHYSSFIPDFYIKDESLRLKYYKKLSGTFEAEKFEEIIQEIKDQFGNFPENVDNLVSTLQARNIFIKIGVKAMNIKKDHLIANFDLKFLEKNETLRDKLLKTFLAAPKTYKFNPNGTVQINHPQNLNGKSLLEMSTKLVSIVS